MSEGGICDSRSGDHPLWRKVDRLTGTFVAIAGSKRSWGGSGCLTVDV